MEEDLEEPLFGTHPSMTHGVRHRCSIHEGAAIEAELMLWDRFEREDNPNMFKHLELAQDGGFSEVDELYAHTRWISAFLLVVFVFYNFASLVALDLSLLGNATEVNASITALGGHPKDVLDAFYFSERMVDWAAHKVTGDPSMNISSVSVLGGSGLIEKNVYVCRTIHYCYVIYRHDGFRRWYSVHAIFWDILPSLSVYSTMKLLYHIVPTVASARAFEIRNEWAERKKERKTNGEKSRRGKSTSIWPVILNLLCWLFMLVFGFIAGFDTFLMKLRIVAARASHSRGQGILPCIQFLVQVLGVVQLGPIVRKRLFIFIFGGEDGIMQDEETELMDCWNALLARRIHRVYGHSSQFFAVMLSFCDEDFQKLVLNEKGDEKDKLKRKLSQN